MTCSVSADEGSFTTVQTLSTSANYQNQRVLIPLTVAQEANYYRVKFAGTGPCEIHRYEMQVRIRRDSYLG